VHNNKKKSWFFKLSVLHLLLAAAAAAHMGKHQSASQAPTPSSQKKIKLKRPLYKASLRNLVLAYTRAFKS
jgi:hypothetical protein